METYETIFKREYERIKEIVQHSDWYTTFAQRHQDRTLFSKATYLAYPHYKDTDITSRLTVAIFQKLLANDAVQLGDRGVVDYDAQRMPIETIVIHHSHRAQGITKPELNALHLLRLYVPVYQNMASSLERKEKATSIASGHFDDNGKQVFYGYHWKVGQNGEVERLLDDKAIGWHAGNREVNKRSIAICIDDDLTDKHPTPAALEGAAKIIADYPQVTPTDLTIRAHCDINTTTTCPGYKFNAEWKTVLLEKLTNNRSIK